MTDLSHDDFAFLDAMYRAVLDQPVGYIYVQNLDSVTTCTYLPTEKTSSCIVGRGVLDGGFAGTDDLRAYEGKSASQVLVGDKALRSNTVPPISPRTAALHPDVVAAAQKIQQWQDSSSPWVMAFNMGITFLIGKGHRLEHLLDLRDWPNNPND